MIITSTDFHVKHAFDDWVKLLEHTSNRELLKDPYSIWMEAFSVGEILMRERLRRAIDTKIVEATTEEHDDVTSLTVDEVKQLQNAMIRNVKAAIETA
jgi:hypothetical protein